MIKFECNLYSLGMDRKDVLSPEDTGGDEMFPPKYSAGD